MFPQQDMGAGSEPCVAARRGSPCPSRVRFGRCGMSALSPFSPQLRTLIGAAGTAEKCHLQTSTRLFDDVVGTGEERRRHSQPERHGCLEVD
jgi:hypothetical protein